MPFCTSYIEVSQDYIRFFTKKVKNSEDFLPFYEKQTLKTSLLISGFTLSLIIYQIVLRFSELGKKGI